jgi:hypothetical protein
MRLLLATIGAAILGAATPVEAQGGPAAPIDPSVIPMPNLAFTPTPEIEGNYDKYFVFNRAATDFATAYADLRECDGYARGLSQQVPGGGNAHLGALGGAIADWGSDAIYGSAERRRQRRHIMLTCMGFKEYRVFGLPKAIWETFNFEEGNRRVPEGERQRMLQIQARVASGAAPVVGEVRSPLGGEARQ